MHHLRSVHDQSYASLMAPKRSSASQPGVGPTVKKSRQTDLLDAGFTVPGVGGKRLEHKDEHPMVQTTLAQGMQLKIPAKHPLTEVGDGNDP